ncbi:NAD(P)/FAD-dependent oxidoreductase [Methanobacterium alcaliphilum]|uniref:NAD(P)/FAD-dependent oxidoreductase n=1 Tax=Methanobacterium alcaliphilum TaxID=392018 RepID=UPI00200AE9A8|nr:NAD(P)/FAD-dependent oxidoreductase [Methanobacterium alcaliphilum]MCK9150713.1 NAD(P)/FAD-dependent oxidoreductase [Methanobacterium alcaliphilum]
MMDIPEKGAKLQLDGKFAIIPHIPGGMLDAETLNEISKVAEKYELTLKITSATRIALIGIEKEDIDKIWEELDMKIGGFNGKCVKSAKFCLGTTHCNKGLQDSVKLGLEINKTFLGIETPNKVKIGISGCSNSCSQSAFKDIGLIGTKNGWKILIGGNGGRKPKIGDLLNKDLSNEEAIDFINRVISYYRKQDTKKRLGGLIDHRGWYEFIEGL